MINYSYPIVNSGHIFGANPDSIYDILNFIEPGLLIDVGAAMGMMTEKMLAASPKSHVIAFEPYPPNCLLFNNKFERDPRVVLVGKAVADKTSGTVHFRVPHFVKGDERGWESFLGYSSVGDTLLMKRRKRQ